MKSTYVMCEVVWLARGIWLSEERRRIGNVDPGSHDLSRTAVLRAMAAGRRVRILVEKHHIGLTELSERMAEVKARYARRPARKAPGSQAEVRG